MEICYDKWGFVRETREMARKKDIEPITGKHCTGLEDYLRTIFPEIPCDEWIHDKSIQDSGRRIRPDYRCERLMLIIEFDGLQHYQQPDKIIKDYDNQAFYESLGYEVIRIPYFIQLTNEVVRAMFGRDVQEPLFDPGIPSMDFQWRNTPAYCCPMGLRRMAKEFHLYPQQYETNMKHLRALDNEDLTGVMLLSKFFGRLEGV